MDILKALKERRKHFEKLDAKTPVTIYIDGHPNNAYASDALRVIDEQIHEIEIAQLEEMKMRQEWEEKTFVRQEKFDKIVASYDSNEIVTYNVSVEDYSGQYIILCSDDTIIAAYTEYHGLLKKLERDYVEEETLKDINIAILPIIEKCTEYKEKYNSNVRSFGIYIDANYLVRLYEMGDAVVDISEDAAEKIVDILYERE